MTKYANAQKKGGLDERIALQSEGRNIELARKSRQMSPQQDGKSAPEETSVSLLEKRKPSVNLLGREDKNNLPDLLSQASDSLVRALLSIPNNGDGAPLLPGKKGKRRKGLGL